VITATLCIDETLDSPQRRERVARRLLRRDLVAGFGLPDTEPVLVRNSFGRPSLADHRGVHVSIAYCTGGVAVACADDRIGIDLENLRRRDRHAAARMLGAGEWGAVERAPDPDREFLRYWTLKESYVKALGVGLSYRVRRLTVRIDADGRACLDRPGAEVWLDERRPGFVVALCRLRGAPGAGRAGVRHVRLADL